MLCKEIQLRICWGMNLICMCLSQLTVLTKSCIFSGIFSYIHTYIHIYLWISYAVQYKIHTGSRNYIVIHWFASSETNTPYIGLDRKHSRWLPKTNSIFSFIILLISVHFICKYAKNSQKVQIQYFPSQSSWSQSISFSPGRVRCNSIVKKDGWLFGCGAGADPRMTSGNSAKN